MKKYGIIGSRRFKFPDIARQHANRLLDLLLHKNFFTPPIINSPFMIVSGGAYGVDSWAKQWAQRRGLPFQEYLPSQKIPSPQRYHTRNDQIIEAVKETGGTMIAFWNGEEQGSGTSSVIKKCREQNVPLIVFKWCPEERIFHYDRGDAGIRGRILIEETRAYA